MKEAMKDKSPAPPDAFSVPVEAPPEQAPPPSDTLQLAWHPTPDADEIVLALLANPRLDQILGITRFEPTDLGRQLWHFAGQIIAGWDSAQLHQRNV